MAQERLQKILARAGVASRRKAEEIVASGRVRVDGRVVSELGAKADPRRCTIELDGRKLEPEPLCYGVFHKPRGMVTTLSDPEGRPTALDVLKQVGVRVVPVGRLDFNTSGALLFTNDGDFAQALQHARGKAPKVYAAKITDELDEKGLERWAQRISIEGKETQPASVRILRREGKKTWLEVTIIEGRNRQVRRLGEHAGTPVERLARLSHAGISAEGLRPGQWRLLTLDELKDLKKHFGVPEKVRGIMQLPHSSGKAQRSMPARSAPRVRSGESRPKRPKRAEAGGPRRGASTVSSSTRGEPSRSGASRSTRSEPKRVVAGGRRQAEPTRVAESDRKTSTTSSRGAGSSRRSRRRR